MKRAVVPRLRDILAMIDAAAEMTDGVEFGQYRADLKLRLAVERSVEIVSEASRHIPDRDKNLYPDVPWAEIAAVGNKLRHEYGRIDDAIMWGIVTRSLRELRPVIVAMIARIEERS